MSFQLAPLPYSNDALMPVISPETLSIHHGKHHAKYIQQTNELIKGTVFAEMSLEEVVQKSSGPLFESAAQAWNHDFLWKSMAPAKSLNPRGVLLASIEASFGSMEALRSEFKKKGETLFGSGWVWLTQGRDGKLAVEAMPNAETPIALKTSRPLLCCDVWEHAYYIDYRNRRPDYLEAYFKIMNWDFAESNILLRSTPGGAC